MKRIVIYLIVLCGVICVSAQRSDIYSQIQSAVRDRNYPSAIALLRDLEASEPVVFKLNNYDYLFARLAERSGDAAVAILEYQAVTRRNSVLEEYALWHLAELARASGNLMLERIYLQKIVSFSPDSLLYDAARNRLARSWFESKNYNSAIKALAEIRQSGAIGRQAITQARENLLLLGHANLYSGNPEAAREIFNGLITNLANPAQPDDSALEAAKGLDLLDVGQENFGRTVPPLSDYEHLRRAQIYQFNRDFAAARLHFSAIINNHPASGIVPDAIFQIGRGYAQGGDFAEAVKWYERVQEQFPDHAAGKDALLQAASAYARLAKLSEAITRYRKYIERYPSDERIDRAYLNIIDVQRDLGEETEALKWAATTQQVFKGKLPEAQALFAQSRIYLARGDWQNAFASLDKLQTFPDLGGVNVPGGTTLAEIAFMRGFVLEQMQRYAEAIDVYLSIPDGRNEYYGGRATERLRLMANDAAAKASIIAKYEVLTASPQAKDVETRRKNLQSALRLTDNQQSRESLLESLRKIYAELPAYRKTLQLKLLNLGRQEIARREPVKTSGNRHKAIADELLFLGLYDEAAPELEIGLSSPKTDDVGYTLANFYRLGDKAYRASAFIEPLWKMPADYQIDLIPKEFSGMLYPAPYSDSLLKYAKPRNVNPRFLLAIMRQESRFRPDVKSYAAARGLMQFISTTSDKIAAELRRENFLQDDLYDPSTAILFGSQYVSNLFRMFPNQPAAVAASYNGGEDNMKRWLTRAKSDSPDRYIPEIAFSQSKDYVYRVMANYRVYRMLYDENLKLQ